ncbi:SIMPL domain-containing protein [Corallincola platygyrae]|uniref:SIMPL domain-containing protein n=1 Tax=Corallincola platygyrae TaxID=1193278 RepID=A0ABW4XSV0_9GAMM
MKAIKGSLVGLLMVLASQVQAGTIRVVGQGQVSQVPDQVVVQLSVVKLADKAEQAKQQADAAVRNVLDAVAALDIPTENVGAADLRLSPKYNYQKRERVLLGMEASRQIRIVLSDASLLASLLDNVVSGGATQVQGVHWQFSQLAKLQHQARLEALKDAQAQAKELAAVLGAKLGDVETIDTQTQQAGVPMPRLRTAAAEMDSYQPASQNIEVQVLVEFELE